MGKKMDLNNIKSNSKCLCSNSGSIGSVTSSSSHSSNGISDKSDLRTVHLKRQCGACFLEANGKPCNKLFPNVKPNNFGFSFRGGREFGTGIFVSAVENDSEAQYKGLKVGDQIVRINGLSVDHATHQEILQLAQLHHHLTLTIKSVGIIPVKDKSDDPITWKVVDGINAHQQMMVVGVDEERIVIEIPESTQLGCGICKGPDWRPGIFVQYTKPNSLARKCGLQPGDQILQCNKTSFLNIDFTYAVSVLKSASTLDLVLKKGSGIDLFPGESSGYSSSSSVADEAVSQFPSKSKRLSMVAEEGDDQSQRKTYQSKSGRANLKPSGSVDSIFETLSNDASSFREKSKSIEILTDSSSKKAISFQNGENISRSFLNAAKPPDPCGFVSRSQTVIKIESNGLSETDKSPTMSIEKRIGDGMISVEVHRTNENCKNDETPNGQSSTTSSFSSSCSLTSAISQEIQKRKERRLKGNVSAPDKKEVMKPVNRLQRHQHDLLIAELKKKQGWEERSTVSTQTELQFEDSKFKANHKTSEAATNKIKVEAKPNENKFRGLLNEGETPPACPTPDYFSDASLTDQSIETSHTVKTSILKFEERNRGGGGGGGGHNQSNGVHKTVTFGENSTKEITPLKRTGKGKAKLLLRHSFGMADHRKSQDRVEMQSIESFDLNEPKKVAPKPPPIYFQQPSRIAGDGKKRTTVIKITEYPTDKRREPGKFNFISRNSENSGFDSELASTLSRSNLKNKTDAFANLSNGITVKTGNENPCNGSANRYNGYHPAPAIIPMGITESQISSVKKALKTFEKNNNNTVLLKIPKIN